MAFGNAKPHSMFQQRARDHPACCDDVLTCWRGRSRTCCAGVALTSATRQCGSGGTASVRCLLPGSGSAGFIVIDVRTGAGTMTRCSCGSMGRPVVCGAPLTRWRSARGFCDQTSGSQGCAQVSETHDEALWPVVLRSSRTGFSHTGLAMNVIGNAAAWICGRWLNNQAENSHQPFRRRERAVARFKSEGTLQKFTSIHASVHNYFNHHANSTAAISRLFKSHRWVQISLIWSGHSFFGML